MNLFELLIAIALFAGYSTLTLTVSLGIAHLLRVHPAIVAFPLAIAPIIVLLRKHWRDLWIPIVPVATAVGIVLGHGGNWQMVLQSGSRWWTLAASAGAGTFVVWVVVLGFAAMIRGESRPGKQPPDHG